MLADFSVMTLPSSQTKDIILPAMKLQIRTFEHNSGQDPQIEATGTNHKCETIHDPDEEITVHVAHDDGPSIAIPKHSGENRKPLQALTDRPE
jgi:hypothetical protein